MSDTRAADPPAQQPGQPGQPADPYRWLENADDPAVREWTEKQEAAYRAAADGWRSRAGARERLRVLLDRVGTPSAPRPAGDRLFLARCRPGGELPELVVVEPDGTERVLVDPALVDPSGSTTLEEFEPSWDGRLLSYQLAPGGTENAVLLVLDVDSGRLLDPPIDRVRRSTVAWLPDSSGFYYVRRLRAEDQYHRRVRLHLLGTDPDTDPVVFGAGRESTQHYTVRISPDGRLLAVSAGAGTARRRDLWLADLTGAPPEAPRWRPVQQDLDARTVLRPRRGPLCHLVTDLDAPRGRLVTTTADRPTPDTWRDLIRRTRTPCWRTSPSSTAPTWTARCCWSSGPGTPSPRPPSTTSPTGASSPACRSRPAARSAACASPPRTRTRPGSPAPASPPRPRCCATTHGRAS